MEKEKDKLINLILEQDKNLDRFEDIDIMEIDSNPDERKQAIKLFGLESEKGDK